jgi:hypothetical protein
VVERILGKAEVGSSILPGGTIGTQTPQGFGFRPFLAPEILNYSATAGNRAGRRLCLWTGVQGFPKLSEEYSALSVLSRLAKVRPLPLASPPSVYV